MRAFAAVVASEWRQRRQLLVAAAVAGFLPFLAPLLPSGAGMPAAEVRRAAALTLALIVLAVASVFLGRTAILGDLEGRRLSFYFTRPLRASDIWAGKLVAAWLMSLALGAIVVLPTALTGALTADNLRGLSGGLVRMLLLVLAAHTLASLVRLRSPWLAIDVLLLAAVGLVLFLARRNQLLWEGANEGDLPHDPRLAIALALTVLALASYVQVAWGRTDPRRSHGALSLTLWGLALPLSLGYLAFVSTGSPQGLRHVLPALAPSGDWVRVQGDMRGGSRSFLLDTGSGRYLRVGPGTFAFSPDGRLAVWAERLPGREFRATWRLVSARLDEQARRRERDDLAFPAVSQIAISPSGARMALVTYDTVSAFEVESGRLLATGRAPWVMARELSFPSEDTVRLLPVPAGRGAPTTTLELSISQRRFSEGPSGEPAAAPWRRPRQLSDGRQALVRTRDAKAVLELHAVDGTLERSRVLGAARFSMVLGEPAPGELLVSLNDGLRALPSSSRLMLLRLPSLEPIRVLLGYGPVWNGAASGTGIAPPSTRFFLDDQAALVRLDVHTGQRTRILNP